MQAEANIVERITGAYVAYRGVRLLCVLAVLLSTSLLFVLAGGFPPYAWRLLAQALPRIPALLAVRGSSVLLALVGVLLLSLTLLIAWAALLWLSWKMLAYWWYERQELRNFAADLEEAQYQAEEADEQHTQTEEFAEEEPVSWQAGRVSAGRSYPPATRRRVIYPLSPLPPQMHDENDLEQAEIDAEGTGNFFVDDEEEEDEMGLYRDEDDDEEDEMAWAGQPLAGAPSTPVPAQSAAADALSASLPTQPVSRAGAPVYDRQIVEHFSPNPASASGKYADNIQHSSYGRILPFSAAPSAGALPHLTSTLYNRVPMPRSVTPGSTSEPGASEPRPEVSRQVDLDQPDGLPQQQQRIMPEQPTSQSAAPPLFSPRVVPEQPAGQPQQPRPAPASKPRLVPPRPAAQLAAAPPPLLSPMPAYIAKQLATERQPLMQRPAQVPATNQQVAPQAPEHQPAAPAQPPHQQTAMQSLVELISTVPLVPPARAPIHIPQPLARSEAAARQSETQLVVSTGLDVGLKRRGKPNEDSLLALQNTRILRGGSCPVGLFVVADGMGGHENGQEASHLVIQSLSKTVVPSIIYGPTDDNYSELLAEGVHHANLEVYQRNRQAKGDMGTTIVAALVVDTTAYVVSAGDSRVYLYRATSGLTQVTRDHSTVARLVESGLLKQEDVYTHPRRNEIYRSLGHHPSEDLDKFILALQAGDVLLLCSDGLWEMVRDAHIREIIASTADQPAQTSAALVQAALDGGGKDNISVIVVYIKAAQSAQTAWAG